MLRSREMTRGGRWKEGERGEARCLDDADSGFLASLKPLRPPSTPVRLMGNNGLQARESEAQNPPDVFLYCMEIKPTL